MLPRPGRRALALVGLVLTLALGGAAVVRAEDPPHLILIVAEGTGFPFEDPTFARFPSLKRLRQNSRPFDATFADDPAWSNTREIVLGDARDGGTPGLVASLKVQRYAATSIGPSTEGAAGFDRTVAASATDSAARVLESLDARGDRRAFVFLTLDLRNVKAEGAAPSVAAPPLQVPAIALFDRGALDPVRFPVIPPPRESADRDALAAQRQAAFATLDRTVGAILAGLQTRGLTMNTVIAVVSAGPAPRPERAAPSRPDLLFEDWLRGLALIQVPRLAQPGAPASTLATLADVAPTLATLGGATMASESGKDLGPALRDPAQVVRTTLLSSAERQAPRLGRSVRSQRYRFTQWPDGSEELFDEQADPREWKNLADAPAMQDRKTELASRLTAPRAPAAPAPARPSKGRRPNVLMIIGDDLTAQYAEFADVKTPNLDRLRARGRSYDKAYAPAPFCTPSRAAFLSGLSPARLQLEHENAFGEVFTPQIPLIQEQFRANGYYTASVGKVWDSQPGEKRGWDLNEWLPPLPDGSVEKPANLLPGMPVEGGPTSNPDEVEGDGRRARLAARILEEKRDQPLFLALGLVRPHVAWIAPQKYFDMYPPDQIRFTPAPPDDTADIPAIAIKNRPQALPGLMLAGREPPGFSNDQAEARRGIAAYLACLTFMDAQLGLVLDALDRNDGWKDTVVVLFGDNGHHMGDHGGLWRKNTLFEESLRVPMIIAAPGMKQPGVATQALADLIDVYPTLVDLTGIARPGTLNGISLTPTLNDPQASVQDSLVQYRPTEPSKRGYSLRTPRYRYTLWPDGSEELYDLSTDSAGRIDLSKSAGQAVTLRGLRAQIEGLVK